jgi:hypothetical protein
MPDCFYGISWAQVKLTKQRNIEWVDQRATNAGSSLSEDEIAKGLKEA